MKRILVTGGAGFIGYHLIELLLKDSSNYVICVDNNFTGSTRNIENFRFQKNFEFIRHDVTIPLYVEVDEIYHMACPASPRAYQHNPIKTIKTNVVGTINMLGLAKRVGARILFTSTSEIYGDPTVSPQNEEYWGNVNPIGPRSCYDEGKRCAETIMNEYHRQHNVDIRIVRIFNTYGPNMDPYDGRVVSNFIMQCLKNEPITLYGDGSQTRSFCYVSDTVTGLMAVMHGNEIGPYNIGNPNEMTIQHLADQIRQVCNSASKIIRLPLPLNDPQQRRPDITKIECDLQWSPTVSLTTGLEKTIDYFKNLQ